MIPNKEFSKVAVLLGGLSAEASISRKTGKAMFLALQSLGYDVQEMEVTRNIAADLKEKNITVAMNALHGTFGEDGCIQGLLEVLGIPYTGSGVQASSTAMNKALSKILFETISLPSIPWKLCKKENQEQILSELKLSSDFQNGIVIKPNQNGSSVGISICKNQEEIQKGLQNAFQWDSEVLIEKYIQGRELTVGVLHDQVLGVLELKPAVEFYDFEAKYTRGDTQYLCPAPLSKDKTEEISQMALKAHQVIGCEGASRVDFLLDANQKAWILEVNTLPGMTETSLLPKIAKQAGHSFENLCELILQSARCKTKETTNH